MRPRSDTASATDRTGTAGRPLGRAASDVAGGAGRCVARGVSVLVALLLAAVHAAAPDGARSQRVEADSLLSVDRYLDWEEISDPRISPDGSRIVYTRRHVGRMEDEWESEIWIMDADGSRNRFLVDGSSPRWSPDGTRVAYLGEGDPEGSQIFVRWLGVEGPATQVTRVVEDPTALTWGPEGERIAFAMTVPAETRWEIPMPAAPDDAGWTEPPRMAHRFHYRFDDRGFLEEEWRHLFVVAAEGGAPRQVTRGDWYVGASFEGPVGGATLSWTPDGETIVFDGRRGAAVDTTYRKSAIWAAELESGDVRRLTGQPGAWQDPVVSPDGRTVAFTGRGPTDLTYEAFDLWLVSLDGGDEGGEKRRISGDLDRDPEDLRWARDGGGLYFTAESEGRENVWFAPADGSGPRQVTEGDHLLTLASLSGNGTAAGVRSSYHLPGDVVRYDLPRAREITRLTSVNDDVLDGVSLGEVEEIWYQSTGGARIQGWIVKPPGFDPAGEYPLILYIHGGPHAMYDVGFSFRYQNFAANGFVVLYTNPRGSTGYGTEFAAAISQDYPGVDHQDLMTGVDTLLARGYVDPDRLHVTGCSGGGVLSSWAIGHTDRFATAAVRCPVTNWLSMAGTTDIPFFTYRWFERPFWEDPDAWLEHSSLMYVGQVETPTLLMTGELDLRTPMAQTEEFYQALKRRGIPTVMLRFRGEYHGTGSKPSNLMRGQLYMMEWFEKEGRLEGITTR